MDPTSNVVDVEARVWPEVVMLAVRFPAGREAAGEEGVVVVAERPARYGSSLEANLEGAGRTRRPAGLSGLLSMRIDLGPATGCC